MGPTAFPDLDGGLRPDHHSPRKRRVDFGALDPGGEKGGDEGVACAGGVDRLDLRSVDAPAALAFRRLGAGRAAFDDDQRVVRREPRALRFGIARARENRGFLFVGEQDCRASRPCEKFVGPDLAQEFRRSRIDADGLVSRAPHDVEDRRSRGGSKERIAGETDVRGGRDQRVRDVARFERFVGAAIGEEAAFAVRVDERDQPPGLMDSDRRRDAA